MPDNLRDPTISDDNFRAARDTLFSKYRNMWRIRDVTALRFINALLLSYLLTYWRHTQPSDRQTWYKNRGLQWRRSTCSVYSPSGRTIMAGRLVGLVVTGFAED